MVVLNGEPVLQKEVAVVPPAIAVEHFLSLSVAVTSSRKQAEAAVIVDVEVILRLHIGVVQAVRKRHQRRVWQAPAERTGWATTIDQ